MKRRMRLRRFALKLLFVGIPLCLIAIVGLGVWLGVARNRSVTLPAPTGQYSVSRTAFDWTDQSRADPFSTSLKHRELPVSVWYPSLSPQHTGTIPYLPQEWTKLYAKEQGIGAWLQQNPDRVYAHAPTDASPAPGRYPVLVFEPGLGKKPFDYTTLLEDIASHGYIVVGIFPTDSTDVVFLDGRMVASVNAARDGMVPDQLINVWTRDTRFVMDRIVDLENQAGSMLAGHIDVARMGVFGHSFGGATAAEVCSEDSRCTAGANLDGTPYGTVVQTGLKRPFLFMRGDECAEGSSGSDCQNDLKSTAAIINSEPTDHYELEIRGAKHFNFADLALTFSPLPRLLGSIGSIDGARGLRITYAYVTAFFDHYLKGTSESLLNGPANDYPEVRFLAFPGSG